MVPRAPPHPSERGARRGRGPSPGSRRAPRGDGLPAHHSKMGSSWYRDLGEDTRGGPGCSQNDACINRPPTGGDLTFSWKEGHICTVVLLEVSSLVTAVSWAAGHGRPMANSSS